MSRLVMKFIERGNTTRRMSKNVGGISSLNRYKKSFFFEGNFLDQTFFPRKFGGKSFLSKKVLIT